MAKFAIRFEKLTPLCEEYFSKNPMYLDVTGCDRFSPFLKGGYPSRSRSLWTAPKGPSMNYVVSGGAPYVVIMEYGPYLDLRLKLLAAAADILAQLISKEKI